jgi:hypothetical protein
LQTPGTKRERAIENPGGDIGELKKARGDEEGKK